MTEAKVSTTMHVEIEAISEPFSHNYRWRVWLDGVAKPLYSIDSDDRGLCGYAMTRAGAKRAAKRAAKRIARAAYRESYDITMTMP
jgi:hypothetical protein